MKNTDNDTTANLKGASASRRSAPARRNVEPPAAIRRNELALAEWQFEQNEIDRKRSEAWNEYPPGTRLFVTTARGIPRRGRAGVVFSKEGRTEVSVVNLDDEAITELRNVKIVTDGDLDRAADKAGVSREEAIAARSGSAVSPLGAKAIAEDDGLQVYKSAGDQAKADRDEELETLRAENAKLSAELAKARKPREANPSAPQRLGQAPKDAAASSSDFGGEEADKAKGR